MFSRFDSVHERDGWTDGQTPRDGIACRTYVWQREAKVLSYCDVRLLSLFSYY